MDGTLIKRDDNFYSLRVDGLVMATSNGMLVDHRLSIKNCESVANGYDLEELFESIPRNLTDENDKWKLRAGFITGFQTAMELLGDKKFSEGEMRKSFEYGATATLMNSQGRYNLEKLLEIMFEESLQQTEWEVEIVEECLDKNCDGINKKGKCITTGTPKLDADGCIVLKRKL